MTEEAVQAGTRCTNFYYVKETATCHIQQSIHTI